jgi:hypothetical protein
MTHIRSHAVGTATYYGRCLSRVSLGPQVQLLGAAGGWEKSSAVHLAGSLGT